MTFQLPFNASDCFVPLFTELDARLDELHLNTYGVSVTTMEEVFLNSAKVVDREFARSLSSKRTLNGQGISCAEGAKHLLVDQTEEEAKMNRKDFTRTTSDIQQNLFLKHFSANFKKRMNYALRDKKMFIMELLIPAVFTAFVFTMVKVIFSMTNVPSYTMNTQYYNENNQEDMAMRSRVVWDGNGYINETRSLMEHLPSDRMRPQYSDVSSLRTPETCETLNKYLWCHDPVAMS